MNGETVCRGEKTVRLSRKIVRMGEKVICLSRKIVCMGEKIICLRGGGSFLHNLAGFFFYVQTESILNIIHLLIAQSARITTLICDFCSYIASSRKKYTIPAGSINDFSSKQGCK